MRRCRSSLLAIAIALTGCASSDPIDPGDREAIDLAPPEATAWSIANVLAPASAVIPRARLHWYAPRVIEIETTPSGASLDIFYLRDNLQQRLAHARAPARVKLPPRAAARSSDVLVVRALLEGYRETEKRVAVRGEQSRIPLDLEPVPNALKRVALSYFDGRASVELTTREKPAFRVNRSERALRVVLRETALPSRAAESWLVGSASSLIDAIEIQPIGSDLVISAALTANGPAGASELPRVREAFDPVRRRHILRLDLDRERSSVSAPVAAVLARVSRQRVTGCAGEYDRSLRAALEPDAPSLRETTDERRRAFVLAAIARLGEISPGAAIRMTDGRVLRVDRPAEMSAAAAEPREALGFLAVLRAGVEDLEAPPDRRAALQSLLAPDLPAPAFGAALDHAEAREAACASSHG
jgi:hypothetical protein